MTTRTATALAAFQRVFPTSMMVIPDQPSLGPIKPEMWVKTGNYYSRLPLHHGKRLLSTFGTNCRPGLYNAWALDPKTRLIRRLMTHPTLGEFPSEATFNTWAPELLPDQSTLFGSGAPGDDPEYDEQFAVQQGFRAEIRKDRCTNGTIWSSEYKRAFDCCEPARSRAAKHFGKTTIVPACWPDYGQA